MISDDKPVPQVEVWAMQIDPESLQSVLKSACSEYFSSQSLPQRGPRFRSAETIPVLVGAIVGISAPLITELARGLFGLLKEKHAQRIVIRDAETTLELPADWLSRADAAQVLSLFEQIKGMSRPKIIV